MKLKILHLVQFLGVGGLEKVILMLIKEQIKAGHEVELVVYDFEQTWVSRFREEGIKVDTSFVKSEGYDPKLLKFLYTKISSFDVLHTHDLNPLMYAGPLKFLHSFLPKKFPKLIHTAHGMDHINKRPVTKLYEKLCAHFTDYTIGVSQGVCKHYLEMGINPKRLRNIDNGTEIEIFNKSEKKFYRKKIEDEFGIHTKSEIWISVARVVPLKDQLIICNLAKQNPEKTYLIVGPSGDDTYWNLIKESKPSNVFMTGGRPDINDLLKGSDYFISASHHEGIPISVLEAGAVGLPCLLSDIPGHKILQKDAMEEVATFFEVGNIDDLCRKSKEIALGTNTGVTLMNHVIKNFSSKNMYEKYLQIYREK